MTLIAEKTKILQWHPRFNVYQIHDKGVALISNSQQLYLNKQEYPFCCEIDGVKNIDEVLLDFNNEHLLKYQISQLEKLNVLVLKNSINNYKKQVHNNPASKTVKTSVHKNFIIRNLSVLSQELVEDLFVNSLPIDVNCHKEIELIIVDDFLDPRITVLISNIPFIVIRVNEENIWVSPLFFSEDKILFNTLQKILLDNQPFRKCIIGLLPNQNHNLPICTDLTISETVKKKIQIVIADNIDQTVADTLTIISSNTGKVECHQIDKNYSYGSGLKNQIGEAIRLEKCITAFNHDGGSRSVDPSYTVEKLASLVSPITGVINHLAIQQEKSEVPILIYRTGFFKASQNEDLETLTLDNFVQICLGKGVSKEQSQASALSEAIERYCALYQNDIPLLKSSESSLKKDEKRILNFHDVVPYSNAQYLQCDNEKCISSKSKQTALIYDDSPVYWIPVWSLTNEENVYVPLSLCFSNIPFDDDQFGRWNSNGCAAGNTLEEAILQGLFELIERDATAIWWYNKVSRPAFDLSRLDQDNLAKLKNTIDPKSNEGYDFWVLDLTTDIGVPVMGAIGKNRKNGGFIMGFGCHLSPEMAAQRALTELCQLIPIRNQNGAPFDFDAIEDGSFLYGHDMSAEKILPNSSNDIKENILVITKHLQKHNFETLVLNYSRAHIPLYTVKVFVPGLCHIWPQLGNDRLYYTPKKMRWDDVVLDEQSINKQGLYI